MLLPRPLAAVAITLLASTLAAQPPATPPGAATAAAAPKPPIDPKLAALKAEVAAEIQKNAKQVQEMVDMVFSFGELGFQEFETSKYLTGILEKDGFTVERGVAGIPTAWVAKWGSGKPVIALGSDLDGIPQSNQKPGVGYRDFLVEGAPGHGEGHNSGQAVNVTAALAVKKIMQREKMQGTILLFPGVAEEQMAGKAFLVRAGVFKDVDATLFTHVGSDLGVTWGETEANALISAEFLFRGSSAHAAGAPWRGKSALDAVMLMAQGWEFKREHLRLQQRSHYVIKNGGDQPNVVPSTASIWFYFRETDADKVQELFETGKRIAQGAAMMTDTKLDTVRILGSGWSGHFNKAIAETMHENIKSVGLPTWDEKDQTLAKGIQRELGQPEIGLVSQLSELRGAVRMPQRMGGGSDDIGDVSWVVPTVTLRFPSNIPNMPGHNWANGISMATPIGHKGAVAGAKVQAMTVLDLLMQPKVVADAWTYFRDVQTKETKYRPLIGPTDLPPTYLNADIMAKYREQMRKYYYDPKKYGTYLEQLGIAYPTVRPVPPTTPVVP